MLANTSCKENERQYKKIVQQEKEKEIRSVKSINEAMRKLQLQLEICESTNKEYISNLDDQQAQFEISWI